MKKLRKNDPVLVLLIAFFGGMLIIWAAWFGYESYMDSREYTIDDVNGIWVYKFDDGQHDVLYIHDGRMEYIRYETEDERPTGFDWYLAMKMNTVPEGTFNTLSLVGIEDQERTQGGHTIWGSDSMDEIKFEFRRNKLYTPGIWGERKFVRAKVEDYPHIVRFVKELERRYELSASALPLEIGEVRCFNRWGATENEFDSFLCIQITNPNPFIIDVASVKLSWEGHDKTRSIGVSSIPANSSKTYVVNFSCRDILGLGKTVNPTECTIGFNRYRVFDGEDKPIVEITDSRVIRDERFGRVTQIEVDTKATDALDDKWDSYDLFAIFYKQDKIVGVATGNGKLESIGEPDVMTYVSRTNDYDRYEVVVVNSYKGPFYDR